MGNTIMSSNEFENWVLSLKVYPFDIHLFPITISERDGNNECILSFGTIDAAISVKKKCQNLLFRGVSLYLTHWHVPRRVTYPKEGFVDRKSPKMTASQPQNSGYSTSTSSSISNEPGNGPLYLWDPAVPAPPQRMPPNPVPVKDGNHTLFCKEDDVKIIEKVEIKSAENEDSLRSALKKQELIIQQLMHQNRFILNELNQQKVLNKCINEEYAALHEKFVAVLHLNSVFLWNADDVIQWITSLDNGWFNKYKYHLMFNMTEEKVTGSMISKFNATDWHRMGIIDRNDQCVLLRHVDKLFNAR